MVVDRPQLVLDIIIMVVITVVDQQLLVPDIIIDPLII